MRLSLPMLKYVFFVAAVVVSFPAYLLGQGIRFLPTQSWTEVIDSARARQLPVFLDAYTTWCAPCKRMVKEVFPDSALGAFFNDAFVSVQLDMEKGDGPMLAERYSIEVYPTLLFVSSDGTLLHKAVGYKDITELRELAQIAIGDVRSIGAMERSFQNGNRDPRFLLQYTAERSKFKDKSHLPVAEAYLNTQPDWSTPQNLKFIYTFVEETNSEMFRYLVRRHELFDTLFGGEHVRRQIEVLTQETLADEKNPASLEAADELFLLVYPERAKRLSGSYRMVFYRRQGDRAGYADAAKAYFAAYDDQAEELSEAAYTFSRVISDPKLLELALSWAKTAVKLEDSYYSREAVAQVYAKMGKTGSARKAARKAIKIAEAENMDATTMRELLKKLEMATKG